MVHDSDDRRIDRGFRGVEGKARFLAADEEHFLSHARTDRIHRDERPSRRLALRRQRLDDEELDPGQTLVFARDDDVDIVIS